MSTQLGGVLELPTWARVLADQIRQVWPANDCEMEPLPAFASE
jgi:hypothetical protein